MNTTILWWLLFVPFVLVAVPVGIFYMRKGYKAGLKHSVLSVCATALSTVAATLLSKLMSSVISWAIFRLVPESLFEQAGVFSGIVSSIVQGVAGIILSFIFFVIFFIVAICVSKNLIQKIKLDFFKDDETKTYSKLSGLGIRAIDTVIVAMLVLIPVYGTMSYTAPVVSSAYDIVKATQEESKAGSYLKCVEKHPMVLANKTGPVSWVFKSLSKLNFSGASINLAEASELLEKLIYQYRDFCEAEGDARVEALQKMGETMRKAIVEKPWFYDVIMALTEKCGQALESMPDSEEKQDMTELLKLFDMTKEQFKDNAITLIDFITYSVENGMVECIRYNQFDDLPDEYFVELGKLINHSDQAVALKREIVLAVITDLYEEELEDYSHEAYEAARNEARQKAQQLMSKHWSDGYVSADLQKREAYSFIFFMFGSGESSKLEAVARHPKFGSEIAMQFVDGKYVMGEFVGEENSEERQALFDNSVILKEAALKLLKDCENTPISENSLGDYIDLIRSTAEVLNGVGGYYSVPYNENAIAFLTDTIGERYFISANGQYGKELYAVLKAIKDSGIDENEAYGEIDFNAFIELVKSAKDPSAWPSKELAASRKELYQQINADWVDSYRQAYDGKEFVYIFSPETTICISDVRIDSNGTLYVEEAGQTSSYKVGEYIDSRTISFSNPYETLYTKYGNFEYMVINIILNEKLCTALETVMEKKGSDPFGLSKKLSSAQKEYFKKCVDNAVNELVEQANNPQDYGGDIIINGDSLEGYIGSGDSFILGGGDGVVVKKSSDSKLAVSIGGDGIIYQGGLGNSVQDSVDIEQYEKELKENAKTVKRLIGVS